ncbi:hypothetical protein D3C85_1633210 [compost metagenome]
MIGAGRAGDSDGFEIGRSSLGHCAVGVGNVVNHWFIGLGNGKGPGRLGNRFFTILCPRGEAVGLDSQ